MVDVVKPEVRSAMMSGIRDKNTRPEMVVRRGLFRRGIRFRLHVASLPGHPDVVIWKSKAAIMIHGCFWHAHRGCKFFRMPEGNREFWEKKLGANTERDSRNIEKLKLGGWRVAIAWECAIRADPEAVIDVLYEFLMGEKGFLEIAAGGPGGRIKVRYKKAKVKPS